LSGIVNPAAMFAETDTAKLMEEIDRYLAAVDLFRAQGCEPTWRPERETPFELERSLSDPREHRVVH
jgi:hypothetical protein